MMKFTLSVLTDYYDFDFKIFNEKVSYIGSLFVRDALTAASLTQHGFGKPYHIKFTGSVPIPKKLQGLQSK